MTKSEAIRQINHSIGSRSLGNHNAHWSNVVEYGAKEGWWLNVPFHKFGQELHLILNNDRERQFLHLRLPANTVTEPTRVFRQKDDTADLFMPISGADRLVDVQSGSGRFDFSGYVVSSYDY